MTSTEMICISITEGHGTSWHLFVDSTYENGGGIARVLGLVRGVFIGIFGKETVDSHPALSVVLYNPDIAPVTYRDSNLIFLSSTGLYYQQHIFQFSHELCHFMVPSEVCEEYRWFEETLCQMMSWYALHKIALMPDALIPKEIKSLKPKMEGYALRAMDRRADIAGQPVSAFIRANLAHLQGDCYDRPMNNAIAYEIYPLFKAHPILWQIVPKLHQLTADMPLSAAIRRLTVGMEGVGGDQLLHMLAD